MTTLVVPSVQYRESFLAALREIQAEGSGLRDSLSWVPEEVEADFGAFVEGLCRFEPPAQPPEGTVPQEERWLVRGDTYLGRVKIRPTLNDRLRQLGGHIGYEVRPSARGQGHAKRLLALGLERLRELGCSRALVTCDVDNLASRRVIEANGGRLEGEFVVDFHDRPIRRYWIEL